jgi:uncharacterized repeat protein (TIGR01451 family)
VGGDTADSDADPLSGLTIASTLISGENDPTWDAGVFQRASLGNFVWNDLNRDGLQAPGETGVVDVVVTLFDGQTNVLGVTTTAVNGAYAFTNLIPGSYFVRFVPPTGFEFTLPDQGGDPAADSDADGSGVTAPVTLVSGENNPTLDAGVFLRAGLGDYVWNDINADGQQDAFEPGTNGIVARLYRDTDNDGIAEPGGDDGAFLATTNTYNNGVGDGFYSFTNLIPGRYFVEFVAPVGMVFSPADAVTDSADSDVSPLGVSPVITLSSGQYDPTWDAGIYVPSSIKLDKSPDLQLVTAGSNATFVITVTNTGLTTLTNVFVRDPAGVACERLLGTLAPDEVAVYTCTVVGVTVSFTNTAFVTGVDPYGNVASDTNDAEVVLVIHPWHSAIIKDPALQRVTNGNSAAFTITVTNVGDVALTNVSVSDAAAPQCDTVIGVLPPGGSYSYNCTVPGVTQDFVNTACAIGYDPLGQHWTDCDAANVIVVQTNREGCTKAANFWYCYTNVWPVETLELGGTTWGKTNLLTLLKTCDPSDVTYQVAKQLSAAQLNAFNGADFSVVAQTMVDAEVWLLTHPLGSNPGGTDGAEGQALADFLLSYNTGVIGPGACYAPVAVDFDGDYVADLGVYWPAQGRWFAQRSNQGPLIRDFGWKDALPFAADYDGDDRADLAVYHPAAGMWYVLKSDTLQTRIIPWGWSESIPVPADYDGDGYEDLAVYHPAAGTWYIRESTNKSVARVQNWGWSAVVPVPGDYDGDTKADIAAYHPGAGNWYLRYSSGGTATLNWGWSAAQPVPADYDGDGIKDLAVYHAATGTWYVRNSGGGTRVQVFGWSEASPVPADYDGDGKADIAVFHKATGLWYILRSENGTTVVQPWGWNEVVPVLPQWQINKWMNSQLRLWPAL